MRWSIIRLIWLRELRDQLRDRRTLLMIAGLPFFLYPILGFAVLHFARGFIERPSVIGVVPGQEGRFPARAAGAGQSPLPASAWSTLAMNPGIFPANVVGASALHLASAGHLDYPPMVEQGQFALLSPADEQAVSAAQARTKLVVLDEVDKAWLTEKRGDLILSAPQDFFARLDQGDNIDTPFQPVVQVYGRPDDDHSLLALRRVMPVLDAWKRELKKVRLARMGLPAHYVEPFTLYEPDAVVSLASPNRVSDLLVRIFPFMLLMWSLAGALYPAIDLCAGEKERGTMETLLISPAGREEIVLGKFLTIWVFSAGTAVLNLLSMGMTTTVFGETLPHGGIALDALLWCMVLLLPQAALFSAISLAIGAYARSSKEGQYYLMPLFVITMPLIFLTLVPGVELSPFYSLVPVTGVALLMQKLMTSSLAQVPWAYFLPVLVPIGLYSWLALRWAIDQFQREDVLFREAEQIDLLLWCKQLFRDRPATPTGGQAFFCLTVIVLLRWYSLTLGPTWPIEVYHAVTLAAFVALPAVLMARLLNRDFRSSLYLHLPQVRQMGLAAVFALLLLPPITGLAQVVAVWFPHLLQDRHPLVQILRAIHSGDEFAVEQLGMYVVVLALLPAVCEELAFRGFLLMGLQERYRPRFAVLLSAFFFALYSMNVFLFAPAFCLGAILGLLTRRSRSVLPAIVLHFLYNAILIASIPLARVIQRGESETLRAGWPSLIAACMILAAGLFWWLYRKPYVDLERIEHLQRERFHHRDTEATEEMQRQE